jgi:hypothetical protein
MKWNWKKIATGAKIALNIAIKAEEAHLIKVKGLDKVKTIKDVIDSEVAAAKS